MSKVGMSSERAPILLIDDSDEDLILTQESLRKARIRNPVIMAHGGEEGIRALQECAAADIAPLPVFVLCDVRMPKVDGFEVLKWVRSRPELSKVYFAMHTGGDVPRDRARAASFGANEVLVKFPTIDQLKKIAHEANATLGNMDHPGVSARAL